jgi:hypothetical protein
VTDWVARPLSLRVSDLAAMSQPDHVRLRAASAGTQRVTASEEAALVTDNVVPDLHDEWTFHQATGMVFAQLGTADMAAAAGRLIALAAQRDECVDVPAALVVARRLRLSDGDVPRTYGSQQHPRGPR